MRRRPVTVKNNTTEEKPNDLHVAGQCLHDGTSRLVARRHGDWQPALIDADQTGAPRDTGRRRCGHRHGPRRTRRRARGQLQPEPLAGSRAPLRLRSTPRARSISNLSPAHNTRTRGGTHPVLGDRHRLRQRYWRRRRRRGCETRRSRSAVRRSRFNKATKPEDGASTVSVNITLGGRFTTGTVTAGTPLGNQGASVAVEAVADDKDTEDDETVARHITASSSTYDAPVDRVGSDRVVLDTSGDGQPRSRPRAAGPPSPSRSPTVARATSKTAAD